METDDAENSKGTIVTPTPEAVKAPKPAAEDTDGEDTDGESKTVTDTPHKATGKPPPSSAAI